jgi:hypothetical protein
VALGDSLSVPARAVAVVNATEHWLGLFGLGIVPTAYNQTTTTTFLTEMVERGLAPSRSYGYSAGAYHREHPIDHPPGGILTCVLGLKGVSASLTLGGYDANRFQPHDVSFTLGPAGPVVAVTEIKVSANPISGFNFPTGWPDDSFSLLNPADAARYTIDSSTPYLWLPESVCRQFERALGLIYDEDVQLYTFGNNLVQRQNLVNWNLTFNFVLADTETSPKSVSLSLPYAAFDLQLTYPFPGLKANESSPPRNYFPLRKAANESQYTIGRCFLQETFLLVDYERNRFSVYQAAFPTNTNLKLVNLPRERNPENNTRAGGAGPPPSNELGKGALAGIIVGAAGVLAAFIIAVLWVMHSRRKRRGARAEKEKPTAVRKKSVWSRFSHWLFGTSEAEPLIEIGGSPGFPPEVAGTPLNELAGNVPIELPGDEPEVPPYVAAQRKHAAAVSPVDHNPKKPVELEHRTSTAGFYGPDAGTLPSPGLAPPYSAHEVGRRNTQTTGVSSRSVRTSRDSSRVSSPMIISPITPSHTSPLMPSSLARMARGNQPRPGNDSDQMSASERGYDDPVSPRSHGEEPMHLESSPQGSSRRFSFEDQG